MPIRHVIANLEVVRQRRVEADERLVLVLRVGVVAEGLAGLLVHGGLAELQPLEEVERLGHVDEELRHTRRLFVFVERVELGTGKSGDAEILLDRLQLLPVGPDAEARIGVDFRLLDDGLDAALRERLAGGDRSVAVQLEVGGLEDVAPEDSLQLCHEIGGEARLAALFGHALDAEALAERLE